MSGRDGYEYRWRWVAGWAVPVAAQLALTFWIARTSSFGSPEALFWLVVIAASLCVVTAVLVIARAFVSEQADLAALGLFFFSVSALPLVHGLTTPGVLVGDNTTTMTSVLIAIPVGVLAVAPLAGPSRWRPAWIVRRWRRWVLGAFLAITALSGTLLLELDLLPAPTPRGRITLVIAAASFAACIALSRRHLRLARIARSRGPLVVATGYGFVGASALVWLTTTPFSGAFWSAHLLDIVGVFASTIGALVVYARTRRVQPVLDPVLVADPLRALEVGLDPIVHRYVADLEAKDPITRDHVARTGELAVRVAEELQLDGGAVRRVGLTALLHDVGKLGIPDEIINKPGRLTDAEFDIIRTHAVLGAELVSASPAIRDIAAGVRGHHERIDGAGYPDGLSGETISLDARIVAVCDAFDAMANTRQYRDGMGCDRAIAVLREHAGAQWDAVVVEALVRIIERDPASVEPCAFERVGRDARDADVPDRVGCDCMPEPLVSATADAHA